MEILAPGMAALRTWMIISLVLYVVGGLSFLLGPNLMLENFNTLSQRLFKDRLPLIPLSTERFWLALTISMMLMLVVICAFVAADPQKYYVMVVVLLFSKAASTIQYIVLFSQRRFLAYAMGFISDGPLFIITLYFFIRAV
ncbi:MAG TPA: hypothetical protein VM658_08570 [bacterium]|nr:hypothetical protein [bacterium]